jgi:hypothetical protein
VHARNVRSRSAKCEAGRGGASHLSGLYIAPSAVPEELASAIIETVNAGARVIDLSAAVARPSARGERELEEALNYAAKRNVIVVVVFPQ